MELLGAALLWFVLVVSPLLAGELVDTETGAPIVLDSSYWITAAIILGLAHAIDSAMTGHFGKKGHHPA